jgi:endo-1,4-beta-xylanase
MLNLPGCSWTNVFMRMKIACPLPAIVFSTLLLPAAIFAAGAHDPILLWPNGAPGSEGQTAPLKIEPPAPDHDYIRVSSIHKPSITPFLPEKADATGAAVIICPGGGHAFLSWDIEGENVAQWLAARGVAGFALQYRLAREPNSPYQVEVHALQDTQRAIRLVRSRAQEWGISPQRIGVMGFSAGGQLAALAANRFDNGLTNAADDVDRVSSKPDFQALLYPAIPRGMTFSKSTTPPAFLVCGYDDRTNISEGLPELYLQLKQAGVSAELHVYSGTGHGFGLRPSNHAPVGEWPQRFLEWAGHSGFLKKP